MKNIILATLLTLSAQASSNLFISTDYAVGNMDTTHNLHNSFLATRGKSDQTERVNTDSESLNLDIGVTIDKQVSLFIRGKKGFTNVYSPNDDGYMAIGFGVEAQISVYKDTYLTFGLSHGIGEYKINSIDIHEDSTRLGYWDSMAGVKQYIGDMTLKAGIVNTTIGYEQVTTDVLDINSNTNSTSFYVGLGCEF